MTNTKKRNTKIISFEGIIGAGKTTTINIVKKELETRGYSVIVIYENVDEWVSDGILQKFYENQERYCFQFQTKVILDKVQIYNNVHQKYFGNVDYIIMERSFMSDFIFANMLHSDKKMDDLEYKYYQQLYYYSLNYSIPSEFINPNIVYLQLNPKIALSRVKQRGRDGESSISYSYEKKLHLLHNHYFLKNKKLIKNHKVMIWDSRKNIKNNKHISNILSLIL